MGSVLLHNKPLMISDNTRHDNEDAEEEDEFISDAASDLSSDLLRYEDEVCEGRLYRGLSFETGLDKIGLSNDDELLVKDEPEMDSDEEEYFPTVFDHSDMSNAEKYSYGHDCQQMKANGMNRSLFLASSLNMNRNSIPEEEEEEEETIECKRSENKNCEHELKLEYTETETGGISDVSIDEGVVCDAEDSYFNGDKLEDKPDIFHEHQENRPEKLCTSKDNGDLVSNTKLKCNNTDYYECANDESDCDESAFKCGVLYVSDDNYNVHSASINKSERRSDSFTDSGTEINSPAPQKSHNRNSKDCNTYCIDLESKSTPAYSILQNPVSQDLLNGDVKVVTKADSVFDGEQSQNTDEKEDRNGETQVKKNSEIDSKDSIVLRSEDKIFGDKIDQQSDADSSDEDVEIEVPRNKEIIKNGNSDNIDAGIYQKYGLLSEEDDIDVSTDRENQISEDSSRDNLVPLAYPDIFVCTDKSGKVIESVPSEDEDEESDSEQEEETEEDDEDHVNEEGEVLLKTEVGEFSVSSAVVGFRISQDFEDEEFLLQSTTPENESKLDESPLRRLSLEFTGKSGEVKNKDHDEAQNKTFGSAKAGTRESINSRTSRYETDMDIPEWTTPEDGTDVHVDDYDGAIDDLEDKKVCGIYSLFDSKVKTQDSVYQETVQLNSETLKRTNEEHKITEQIPLLFKNRVGEDTENWLKTTEEDSSDNETGSDISFQEDWRKETQITAPDNLECFRGQNVAQEINQYTIKNKPDTESKNKDETLCGSSCILSREIGTLKSSEDEAFHFNDKHLEEKNKEKTVNVEEEQEPPQAIKTPAFFGSRVSNNIEDDMESSDEDDEEEDDDEGEEEGDDEEEEEEEEEESNDEGKVEEGRTENNEGNACKSSKPGGFTAVFVGKVSRQDSDEDEGIFDFKDEPIAVGHNKLEESSDRTKVENDHKMQPAILFGTRISQDSEDEIDSTESDDSDTETLKANSYETGNALLGDKTDIEGCNKYDQNVYLNKVPLKELNETFSNFEKQMLEAVHVPVVIGQRISQDSDDEESSSDDENLTPSLKDEENGFNDNTKEDIESEDGVNKTEGQLAQDEESSRLNVYENFEIDGAFKEFKEKELFSNPVCFGGRISTDLEDIDQMPDVDEEEYKEEEKIESPDTDYFNYHARFGERIYSSWEDDEEANYLSGTLLIGNPDDELDEQQTRSTFCPVNYTRNRYNYEEDADETVYETIDDLLSEYNGCQNDQDGVFETMENNEDNILENICGLDLTSDDDDDTKDDSPTPAPEVTVSSRFKFSVTPVSEQEHYNSLQSDSGDTCSSLGSPQHSDNKLLENQRKRVSWKTSSLKSSKTTPGSPRQKKIVRFADSLGLDLEAVRHIVSEDIPIIPESAYIDLILEPEKPSPSICSPVIFGSQNCLYPQFSQPFADKRFIERVKLQRVCLENVVVSDMDFYGVVRVLNSSLPKSVKVRYTMDDWQHHGDISASYIEESSDGITERFQFCLQMPDLQVGEKVVFAIQLTEDCNYYWDNNDGIDYELKCVTSNQVEDDDDLDSEDMFSFV